MGGDIIDHGFALNGLAVADSTAASVAASVSGGIGFHRVRLFHRLLILNPPITELNINVTESKFTYANLITFQNSVISEGQYCNQCYCPRDSKLLGKQ